MVSVDMFVFGVILAVMIVIFFIYLMLRKSLLSFKQGYKDSRR